MPPGSESVVALVAPAMAAMFAFALGAKIRDWPDLADWFEQLRVPYAARAAVVGLASEGVLIAALLAVPPTGLRLTIVWLVAATALLLQARRVGAPCACFGRSTGRSWPAMARNVGLAGLALLSLGSIEAQTLPIETGVSIAILGPGALLVRSIIEP